jgi:hypothetical protein
MLDFSRKHEDGEDRALFLDPSTGQPVEE